MACKAYAMMCLPALCVVVPQPAAKELRGTLAASTLSGPNIFTDIAYDTSAASAQLGLRNAYISSAGGAVFVVDYDRWGGVFC
jgi:hypothetical protein